MASRGCRKRRAAAIKAAAKFGDQLNPNERLEDGSGKTTMDNVKAKETVDRLSRKYMVSFILYLHTHAYIHGVLTA